MPSAERRHKPTRRPARLWLRFPDEATACPGCASSHIRLLDVIAIPRDTKGRRVSFITGCDKCGLLFSNPPPTRDELERYYSTEGPWAASHEERTKKIQVKYLSKLKKKEPPQQRADRGAHDVLFDALAAYVPLHAAPLGAKVLDFGCGVGNKFLEKLQDWGWQTFGIEPSTSVAFLRHQRLDVPPQDGSFDFVILHHVLEHIAEPLSLLRQLAGSLRESGVLFLSVPRLDTLAQHRDLHYCVNGRTHVVCFTESCLQNLLARAGLAVTARLDQPELDDAETDGKPLRLRLVATRTATPPPAPAAPLAPALNALRQYASASRGLAQHFLKRLPVRVRAALMDRARERSRGLHAER